MRSETNAMFPTAFGTKECDKAIQRMTIIGVWSILEECVLSFMVLQRENIFRLADNKLYFSKVVEDR